MVFLFTHSCEQFAFGNGNCVSHSSANVSVCESKSAGERENELRVSEKKREKAAHEFV